MASEADSEFKVVSESGDDGSIVEVEGDKRSKDDETASNDSEFVGFLQSAPREQSPEHALANDESPAAQSPPTQSVPKERPPKRILILEDDANSETPPSKKESARF